MVGPVTKHPRHAGGIIVAYLAVLALTCSATASPSSDRSKPAGVATFQTPSGNIVCGAGWYPGLKPQVVCDVIKHTWKLPPPPPGGCRDISWGQPILNATGPGRFHCTGGAAANWTGNPTLGYGVSRHFGPFRCVSRVSGLSCYNRAGHGFTLARASYRFF
jgi:hypothetical protein